MTSPDRMLRPGQVGALLGVSAATIGRWVKAGILTPTFTMPHGEPRFRRGDLETTLAATAASLAAGIASNRQAAADINGAVERERTDPPDASTVAKVRPGRRRRYFGSLEVRDNGVFYAYWYNVEKKRVQRKSLRTRDPDEARRLYLEHQAAGPPGTRAEAKAPVTVSQALDWYFDQHVTPNVVDKQRQLHAIAHLKAFFGPEKPLAGVDILASRAYASARRSGLVGGGARRPDRRGSDSTVRRELVVLIAAANLALRWKQLTVGEMPSVELPVEQRTTQVKWLTKEQVNLALKKATGRLRDFIELGYYTAGRRKSIERLLKSQVDLAHGVIDLQPPGGKATTKRRPKVPIFPSIRPTVERLMADETSPYLLGPPTSMYRPFVDLMAEIGVEAWPHMLRHSRATHLLLDGEDIYKVARLLGDTVATVERVYGHYGVDYLHTNSTLESR